MYQCVYKQKGFLSTQNSTKFARKLANFYLFLYWKIQKNGWALAGKSESLLYEHTNVTVHIRFVMYSARLEWNLSYEHNFSPLNVHKNVTNCGVLRINIVIQTVLTSL